jgi:hypothetical protein
MLTHSRQQGSRRKFGAFSNRLNQTVFRAALTDANRQDLASMQ